MAADVSSEAVVLRRIDSGESDRRLTLLTSEHGKLDVIAKGARKGGSRLAGSSEPLVKAVFTWAEGRARRFVTSVQPITSFPGIRADYDKMMAALALAELMATSLPFQSPQHDSHESYELFVSSLLAIENSKQWSAALVWSEVRLMESEGVHPEWTVCAANGKPLSENPAWVSPMAGGFVETRFAGDFTDRFLASAEALITLSKVTLLAEAPDKMKNGPECLRILFHFWRHHLESRLPANEALVQGLPSSYDE